MPTSSVHFDDLQYIKIADFQDKGLTDSLYHFFDSSNPHYRAAAALAFGSVKDTSASGPLGNLLLEDPDMQVRINAAFALGQCGGIAGVNALIPAMQDKAPPVVREVLGAIGKCVKRNDLYVLQQFAPTDSITEQGYAQALYRIGSRGLADSAIIEKEIKYLDPGFCEMTRLAAANFFARSQLSGARYEAALIRASLTDPSADVRMVSAAGLRKLKSDAVFATLSMILKKEKDYRVRISAVRSLGSFDYEKAKPIFLSMLNDREVNVGIATSEIIGNAFTAPSPDMLEAARTAKNWRIQANLYKAVLKADPSKALIAEVKRLFAASSNNYQKAWLLGAIACDPNEHIFIRDVLVRSSVYVIKSSAADALVNMNRRKNFPVELRAAFANTYKMCIQNGDPAVVGIISTALADSTLMYRKEFKDISFLREAKSRMTLPRDIESLQPLENAIAYFDGIIASTLKNTWNHPILWDIVNSVKNHDRAVITTSKGEIVMRLLPIDAPGSVANFVSLVRQKYFEGKFFHRTVPNFVIQTGCNRGDGYGSEDYSIRSEFSSRHYKAGSVGMASAGKDTEGTQWFITHSTTPHLDGRYSIFAEVEAGMDVVDAIEVGDQIIRVVIK